MLQIPGLYSLINWTNHLSLTRRRQGRFCSSHSQQELHPLWGNCSPVKNPVCAILAYVMSLLWQVLPGHLQLGSCWQPLECPLLSAQSTNMAFGKVTEETVYTCTGHPLKSDIANILDWMLNQDFTTAYRSILFRVHHWDKHLRPAGGPRSSCCSQHLHPAGQWCLAVCGFSQFVVEIRVCEGSKCSFF